MLVQNSGNPKSKIWILVLDPYESDNDKGIIWSGGHGYTFRKVWELSGLPEPYIYVLRSTLGATYDLPTKLSHMLRDICDEAPPFILPTSVDIFEYLCADLVTKSQRKAILKKYSGNLLNSHFISYPHYIIPQYPPDFVSINWDYHEIQAHIDLGHVKEELDFYTKYGTVQSLPKRNLITEPDYGTLITYLEKLKYASYISTDIETIRPGKQSLYKKLKNPGYPITNSFAPSINEAISYNMWDYTTPQLIQIWRLMDYLLRYIPQIGQNYFTFDAHYFAALGFRPCLHLCQDTLIRHHILWPALEHKLQFQTKQYTRQPFYKDEGKHWNLKQMGSLMRYNCLDTCVTYEIFEAQEKEFDARPHLR